MEAEERPNKIRKLSHDAGDEDAKDAAIHIQKGNHDNANATIKCTFDPDRRQRTPPPEGMSRSAYKKMKRNLEYEAGKAERRAKEKLQKKEKRAAKRAAAKLAGGPYEATPNQVLVQKRQASTLVPVTVILDCGFDELMTEIEVKSLGQQITRCYSDNAKAKYKVHLAISSFNGRLRERYDGVLNKQHKHWKGVRFLDEDFVNVARQANEWMKAEGTKRDYSDSALANPDVSVQGGEYLQPKGEVIYLSAESDNIINQLEPYSTYIVGGLVDRNRHKGICYKTAMDAGIKTARLPIGEFLEMASRKVLATNHVNEILLSWLELGDWGDAFLKVIPKRKGLALKTDVKDGDVAEGGLQSSQDKATEDARQDNDPNGDAQEEVLGSEMEENKEEEELAPSSDD